MSKPTADDADAFTVARVVDLQQELRNRIARRRAYLIVVAGSNVGEAYGVEEGETFIGRGQNVTVRLPDDTVSRRHARLVQGDGGVVIEDLGSSRGTMVNGVALARQQVHPLQYGDEIRLGPTTTLKLIKNDPLG